jgi:branched-chain amino acid transport system substrate-binding protein
VVIAGCGSRSSNSPQGATSSGAAAGTPIKVGVICSCTGAAGLAETLVTNGYLAWAKGVNEAGGINGHRIEIDEVDDQTNPGLAVTKAQQLLSDGVVAVEVSSLVQQAFLPVLAKAKVPVVGESFGIPGLPDNTDVFDPSNTLSTTISAASTLSLAKKAGVTKLAYMYEGDTGSTQLSQLKAAIAQDASVKLVYSVETSLTQTSYVSECIAAMQAGANGLVAGTGTPTNIENTASDCARQNFHPAYFAGTENWASFPALASNTYMTSQSLPYFADNAAVKLYIQRMNKYYPGQFNNPAFDPGNSIGIYAGGLLLEDALKAAKLTSSATATSATVLDGLYALRGDTLGGIAPPVTFQKGKVNIFNCWFESRIKNGKFEVLNGGKAVCTS